MTDLPQDALREKWFPLLGTPFAILRSMLNEEQAKRNHYQALDLLAKRGGLDPSEALAVIERRACSTRGLQESFAALIAAAPPNAELAALRQRCEVLAAQVALAEQRESTEKALKFDAIARAEQAEREVKAARDLCEQWHADARADGYGGGNARAHEMLDAMNAAIAANTNPGSNTA